MAKARIGLIGLVGAEAKADFWGTMRRVAETGVEWIVVEQDQLRNLTAFETITVSYLNLKEAGLV